MPNSCERFFENLIIHIEIHCRYFWFFSIVECMLNKAQAVIFTKIIPASTPYRNLMLIFIKSKKCRRKSKTFSKKETNFRRSSRRLLLFHKLQQKHRTKSSSSFLFVFCFYCWWLMIWCVFLTSLSRTSYPQYMQCP